MLYFHTEDIARAGSESNRSRGGKPLSRIDEDNPATAQTPGSKYDNTKHDSFYSETHFCNVAEEIPDETEFVLFLRPEAASPHAPAVRAGPDTAGTSHKETRTENDAG